MVKPSCKEDSGAALLLALWALFLLAGVVFAWALNINSRVAVSATASRVLSAEAMASSGAEVALNPMIKPASANLHRKMGNESYDVEITGECGRFNLNLLAPGGVENPVLIAALRQYLNIKGVDLNDLDVMMDSLLDWITPTKGLHRLNAPDETDDYRPTHAALTSVDELKKIADGTKISLQLLAAVSRSTRRTPRVTCYARLEFQMSLLIASFRCGVGRMEWMEQPTIPKWIRQWLFLSLGLELVELGPDYQ
jgi:type II secretory pathway component PulK